MATTKARKTLSWLGYAGLLGLGLGCSSQSLETKRQLETLNERMLILQNDRDRLVERVDALEAQVVKPKREPDELADSVSPERPPLRVVHLEPATAGGGGQGEIKPEATSAEDGEGGLADGSGVNAVPVAPPEPKVVLYGEGTSSGMRPSAEGVATP